MHCHLRALVLLFVLGFNHDAHDALTYEFSAKWDTPRLHYYDLAIFRLGTVHHVG